MYDELSTRIREYWEDPEVESMADHHLAALEAEMVAKHIQPDDRVLDLGCGDGGGSTLVRARCRSYLGLDRSSVMLRRFMIHHTQEEDLLKADLTYLPFRQADFTVILTQRALINLLTFDAQKRVLSRLPALLAPGGRLILCEAFVEGVEKLNELRVELGCEPIEPRWHNCFLNRSLVADALSPSMQLVFEEDLSLYYFLTRVVHQTLVGKSYPQWDSPINRIARQLSQSPHAPRLRGLSTLVLQVWRCRTEDEDLQQ